MIFMKLYFVNILVSLLNEIIILCIVVQYKIYHYLKYSIKYKALVSNTYFSPLNNK